MRFPQAVPWSIRLALPALLTVGWTVTATAQTDLPPEKGGTTYELGMPPVYKGNAGAMVGAYRPSGVNDLSAMAHFGIQRDLLSPVIGVAALHLEGSIGVAGRELNGGGRLLFKIPSLHISLGPDYDAQSDEVDLLLRLELATRRGGIFGRASMLRIDYLPGRENTVMLGIDVPLWGRNLGKTRPRRDAVQLADRPLNRMEEIVVQRPDIDSAMARVRESALWIGRMVMPLVDRSSTNPAEDYAEDWSRLADHLTTADPRFPEGHTLEEEVCHFHAELDRSFLLALSGPGSAPVSEAEGQRAAAMAKRVLLDDIVFPYNRLLGQRKAPNLLDQFVAVAHTRYARWITTQSGIPRERWRAAYYAFQTLVDIVHDVWAEQEDRWEDSRFVWIPLQLGFRPDEHDTQAELDNIIERAVDQPFEAGNRVNYVLNEDFQLEVARSVLRAEDYHVLWIHDYRGKNGQGDPDEVAFEHTLNYLRAMTARVRAYNDTGTLPLYFLFLDQHYFELNHGRIFLRVLHDPLDYTLRLPRGYEAWEERLAMVQDSLRQAVDSSITLQISLSQFGEKWLRNQLKVHINITNPADFSFSSNHVAGILPIPDNMMRDHRKIAFYDLTEDDPYQGWAMFTGMGIGEHYAGRNWEDRAIMIQGPGALPLKDAARHLLEVQGFAPHQMPYPLRARPKPSDYQDRVAAYVDSVRREWHATPGRVLQLHNETGFTPKPINVAKAVIYSMMPADCLMKIPDSLWQSYVYASMLLGSVLRGCDVLIYSPTLASAPAKAPGSLTRAHDLMKALVDFKTVMAPQLAAVGGVLRIGMYAPRYGVGDLRGRVTQAREGYRRWFTDLAPPNPAVSAVLDSLDRILEQAGYADTYLVLADTTESPKLHMKANFMISGETWQRLMALPEWGPVMREYIVYLAKLTGPPEDRPAVDEFTDEFYVAMRDLVNATHERMSPEERAQAIAYLTVGSVNMDYRSMTMDGEAMVITTGWATFAGLLDFLILPGLCIWIDEQSQIDELLPRPGGPGAWTANLMKLSM